MAIIGPSGAGKSSLLNVLATALQPSAGELAVLGVQPWQLSSRARQRLRARIGLIHQAPPLPPRQRVVTAVLAGKLAARRAGYAPLAGKSTLNRLELSRAEPSRYHRISHDTDAVAALFVDLFLDAHHRPPAQITLDLDATDDPLHGHQEGRFFHGYYDGHCYLPLYVFCGRHLLTAKLRRSNIDASAGAVEEVARIVGQVRACWPRARIVLRADGGFAREPLMAWCEANRVDYLFGLARTSRLVEHIHVELAWAEHDAEASGRPARRFADFRWTTRLSWSRRRRVVAFSSRGVVGSGLGEVFRLWWAHWSGLSEAGWRPDLLPCHSGRRAAAIRNLEVATRLFAEIPGSSLRDAPE